MYRDLRILSFLTAVCLGIFGLAAFHMMPLDRDVFEDSDPRGLRRLAHLPKSDIAEAKMIHAWHLNRIGLGFFGNSRMHQVRTEAFEHGNGTVFNFAVSGTSIRQSVVMLQSMAEQGRSPDTAVVQVDNFESAIPDNPVWPKTPRRWWLAAADLWTGWQRPDVSLHDFAWNFLRYAKRELSDAVDIFNIELLWARSAFRWRDLPPLLGDIETAYRPDGSFPEPRPAERALPIEDHTNLLLPGFFNKDIEALSHVGKQYGIRVILLEMPLEPTSAGYYQENPTRKAKAMRREFILNCTRLNLECRLAPVLPGAGRVTGWPDTTHPPEKWLVNYILTALTSPTLDIR